MSTGSRSSISLLCLFLALAGTARAQQAIATFTFEDHLKRAGSNELAFHPVDRATWGRRDRSLHGPDSKGVPLQWATTEQAPNGKASGAFLPNVPEFWKAGYSLVAGGNVALDHELRTSGSATSAELGNALIGLRLHRGAKALSEGPFAGVRLPSGA